MAWIEVACEVVAHEAHKKAADGHEIDAPLLESAFGKRRKRDNVDRDVAEIQRQIADEAIPEVIGLA